MVGRYPELWLPLAVLSLKKRENLGRVLSLWDTLKVEEKNAILTVLNKER
jgi:hypothetical protein